MGQPTPPGDMPLFEGLGTEWNDIVGALPEDRRAELAPKIKERLDSFAPLKQWEEFNSSGITPSQAAEALTVFRAVENNPRDVYEAIGKHLGITPQQAQAAVKELEDDAAAGSTTEDPRLTTMQNQLNTLAQIALAQRNQTVAEQQAMEQDAAVEKEFTNLKKKYNDVDEEEVLMRMIHKGLTAEQAYQEYSGKVTELRRRPVAPVLLGSGGAIPQKGIDVTKLDNKDTKNLVAQYMQQANNERNQ
jgi:hypothetical protein